MNHQRRTNLTEANALLTRAASIVERARDEEQDGLDNLPENLQYSEKGEIMESAIEELDEAIDLINDATDHIDRAQK